MATGDAARVRYESGAMILRGKGQSPKDSAPLSFVAAIRRTK
jgi:hypothetical protein